jgi:hypothetical protein
VNSSTSGMKVETSCSCLRIVRFGLCEKAGCCHQLVAVCIGSKPTVRLVSTKVPPEIAQAKLNREDFHAPCIQISSSGPSSSGMRRLLSAQPMLR